MKTRNITLFTAIAAAAAFASSAQAGVIYTDDFSGAAGDLNGTGPGWTATAGAGTWQLDGSGKATTGSAIQFAWLAFTPTSGNEYTLSADVDVTSGGWLSIDFARDGSTPSAPPADGSSDIWVNDTYAWMLRTNGDAVQTFSGAGVADNGSPNVSMAGLELKVVLNTELPAWTAEYFIGGTSLGAPIAYATNPTDIRWVGFGRESGNGTVDNFLLTEAIPEPSSLSLLALGGLALLRRRRA